MTVEIFKEEIDLDIMGIPDKMIPKFRKQCEKKFGIKTGLYDYPPDAVFPPDKGGKSVYSCKDAPYAGHHVTLTIESSKRSKFHDFFFEFCRDNELSFSIHNTQALI